MHVNVKRWITPFFCFLYKCKKNEDQCLRHFIDGALGRTRTGTGLKPADFESAASTNFATRASRCSFIIHESTDKSNNQFIFLAATKILKNDGNI